MKRILQILISLFCFCLTVDGQNSNVSFEDIQEWDKIVKKAKKAKKIVLVDGYTSWCGPCKALVKEAFAIDSIADFFNSNFLNVKFDMEKTPTGIMLKQKYGIKTFPTLLFIDPQTGNAIHRIVGYRNNDHLMKHVRKAVNKENNLAGLKKRFEAGERSKKLTDSYVETLDAAQMDKEMISVLPFYLDNLPDSIFFTQKSWELYDRYVHDPLTLSSKRYMAERYKIYPFVKMPIVDYRLYRNLQSAVMEVVNWNEANKKPFNPQKNTDLIEYMMDIHFKYVPGCLAYLYTAEYVRKKDFKGMLERLEQVCSYNLFEDILKEGNYMFHFIATLKECNDMQLVKEGLELLKTYSSDKGTNIFFRSAMLSTQVTLLKKLGDKENLEKAGNDLIKCNQEVEKAIRRSFGH